MLVEQAFELGIVGVVLPVGDVRVVENIIAVVVMTEFCTEVFDALHSGIERWPLQPYGATNPAEFFAVATEAFFDVPVMLEQHEPNLYEVMRDFYKQDPAARLRR